MSETVQPKGVVVPMVTPATPQGQVDEAALDRLLDFLLRARVSGVFALGTTGEGPSVPRQTRRRLVRAVVERVQGRAHVYAGIGDTSLADSLAAAADYFEAGVTAVVAQPPGYYPLGPAEMLSYFQHLLDQAPGPVVLYNIPSTTHVSVPLDVVERLAGHPRLVGMKDSENNAERLAELLARFANRPGFAVLIGVGALMSEGLRRGAAGIVPSVGNLIPEECCRMCERAQAQDWQAVDRHARRLAEVAALYQRGRTLGQSLAALKAVLDLLGVCGPHMFPPLLALHEDERKVVAAQMQSLGLTTG